MRQLSWVRIPQLAFFRTSLFLHSSYDSRRCKEAAVGLKQESCIWNIKRMTRLGFEPRTLSVLTICDNQLHHPAIFWLVCCISFYFKESATAAGHPTCPQCGLSRFSHHADGLPKPPGAPSYALVMPTKMRGDSPSPLLSVDRVCFPW